MRKAKTKRPKAGIKHHAKRIYHLTPRFIHGMVIGGFVGLVIILTLGPIMPVHALSLSSPRDCDTNAVINCGALTTTELQQKYHNAGVAAIYSYFGISAQDIQNIGTTAVAGRVYKNGEVRIGDTVVATGAITVGRENISGSTKVTSGGVTFYTRPPSVSFRATSIAAFVVMDKGEFKFAILGSCSNSVKATPVPKEKPVPPQPVPEEPVPEITPAVEVKTSTQTPESAPTPILPASATTEALPVTGPGDIGLVILLAIVGGYIYHVTHRHIRRKRQLRQNL